MVASKKLALLLTVSSFASLSILGCAAPTGDNADDEGETEGVGETNDELRSTVSCQEKSDVAYRSGSSFPIQVVHIGGKPTTKTTGHAFLKMQAAANDAGVRLSITSGFRTQEEQRHLYYCYTSGSCNNGSVAAPPGYSNHQSGLALDLSTSTWLAKNAPRFGFVRTVAKEAWHYEYHGQDPGGPCTRGNASAASPGSDTPGTDAEATPTPAGGALTWVAPAQGSTLKNGFVVKAHPNQAGIVKVVYSQGTLDFGASNQAQDDFALRYTFQFMGDKTLTAKGYDASGTLLAEDSVDFTLLP